MMALRLSAGSETGDEHPVGLASVDQPSHLAVMTEGGGVRRRRG